MENFICNKDDDSEFDRQTDPVVLICEIDKI